MATVLITGANRGIGLELIKRYLQEGWQVHACCREPNRADDLRMLHSAHPGLVIEGLDLLRDDSIQALALKLRGQPIDLLINNAGMAADKERQGFGTMDYAAWGSLLRVNTMAPMKMMEALMDNLEAGRHKHVVNISSALASIHNQQGYLMAYASSKTAMNSVMKSLSIVLKERGIRVNMISPGWVRTRMGGPEATLSPEQSATRIYQNIEALKPEDTGLFIGPEGNIIHW